MSSPSPRLFKPQIYAVMVAAIALSSAYVLVEWRIYTGSLLRGSGDAMTKVLLAIMVSAVSLLFLGLVRAGATHPANNRKYRQWLETSPWSPGVPLPLGPVGLRLADLLAVGVIAVMIAGAVYNDVFLRNGMAFVPVVTAGVFCAGYAAGAGYMFFFSGQPRRIVPILAVAPLFLLVPGEVLKLLVIAAVLALADLGLRGTLRSFPWPMPPSRVRIEALGFPFDRLGPSSPAVALRGTDKITLVILAGWWAFALASLKNRFFPLRYEDIRDGICIMSIAVASVRTFIYCWGYFPPLWLYSRIRLGRPIIPGYDYVLVAPLAVIALGWIAPMILAQVHVPEPLAVGVLVAAVLGAGVGLGPSLQNWRLTGSHHMSAVSSSNSDRRPLITPSAPTASSR